MNVDNTVTVIPPPEFGPHQPRPLLPEEIAEFRDCIKSGFIKTGIPTAILIQALSTYRSQAKYKFTPLQIPVFFINSIIGSLLYSPVCYKKLQDLYIINQQKIMQEKNQSNIMDNTPEGSATVSDDINYQSKYEPSSFGPEGSFSHLHMDIGSSYSFKPIQEDIQVDKPQDSLSSTITYEDLRKQNRETYVRSPTNLSPPRSEFQGPITPKQNVEPPPRRVIRNKYGDEMES